MQITRLKTNNYMVFESIEAAFVFGINILNGENGTGKNTYFEDFIFGMSGG